METIYTGSSGQKIIIYTDANFIFLRTATGADISRSILLSNDYNYKNTLSDTGKGESLGIYEGAGTYKHFYCRPTENSIMRSQFDENGKFFNAISRWAIWYRVMKLSGKVLYPNFKSSLDDFIVFDNGLNIIKNQSAARSVMDTQDLKPLAPPVLLKGQWINGRLVLEK